MAVSCTPRQNSYRLLDARTGWAVADSGGLRGLDDPAGLRLGSPPGSEGLVHVADLADCLLPAGLTVDQRGRLTRALPDGLQELDPSGRWQPLPLPDAPATLAAVAGGRELLAVADAGARRVDLLRGTPPREVLRIHLSGRPRLVALTPWALVAVVTEDPAEVLLLGPDGHARVRRAFPDAERAAELGMACMTTDEETRAELLLALRIRSGWRRLLRLDRRTLAADPVPRSALVCPRPAGFRVEVGDDEGWRLEPGADPPVQTPRRYAERGLLRTAAIDSGVQGCEWHRLVLDVTQPPGTLVAVRVAVGDDPADVPEDAWRSLPPGTADALLVEPRRGRYLRLELTLSGDGRASPAVRAVRAHFDVTTSLDRLPEVYRSQPAPAEFTRRFLSLFDASLDELDEVIAQASLLFDPCGIPDHVLPALAAMIGVRADPSWTAVQLRHLLCAWPDIAPILGTPEGIRRLIAAVYSVDVLVEEPGGARPWGALGRSRVHEVRLFGLARASLRLGTGRLGEARVVPSPDPLAPARGSGAWRCVVHVPAGFPRSGRPGLEALVRTVLPGHVSAAVRYASPAMVLGRPLPVGIGTRLGSPAAVRLCGEADHAPVLGRRGLLGSRGGGGAVVTVGRRPLAGMRG